MENNKFLIIILTLFCILSCTVNDNNGLVTITNNSDNDVTLNFSGFIFVTKGNKYDYWYFRYFGSTINTKSINASGINKNGELTIMAHFKLGYTYNIDIQNNNNNIVVVSKGIKYNGNPGDSNYYDDPWYDGDKK